MRMRKTGSFLTAITAGLMMASAAWSAPSIGARVSTQQLGLNDSLTLSIDVNGISDLQAPSLNLPDFTVQPAGQTSSFQWVNGQSSSLVTFNYLLTPTRAGQLTIPGLTLQQAGQSYSTQPIVISVRNDPSPPSVGGAPASSNSAQGGDRSVPSEGMKPVFLTASLDKSKVYVGQQMLLTVQFLRRPNVELATRPRYQEPDMSGFVVEPLKQQEYSTNLNGAPYVVTELRYALFPTSDGDFAIGSALVEVGLRTPLDPFDPNSFFQNFFNQGQVMKLTTRAIPVNARALPKNRPDNFTGAIGRYKITSSIDNKEPEVGKPFNLIVKMEGIGSVKSLREPTLPEIRGVRKYETITDTKVNNEGKFIYGSKEFKILMIPQVSGPLAIPALMLSYFNPDEHQYETATAPPILVQVKPGALTTETTDPSGPVDANHPSEGIRVVEKDIRFIKTGPVYTGSKLLVANPGFWIAFVFPPILALIGALTAFRDRRRQTHSSYFRSKEAWARAKRQLRHSRRLIKSGDDAGFYAALQSSLLGYLSDKSGLSSSGLLWEDIDRFFEARSVSPELRQTIKGLWDTLDMARYGLSPGENGDRASVLKELESTLKKVEEVL